MDSTSAGATTTRFLYSGLALLGEQAGSGGPLLRRYVPGPGMDEPVVWYEGSGTTDRRWLQADERGSVVAVSDAGGNAIAINRYDEYGIPQSGNLGRFQYTGQAWLAELGMYYYKARIYSPTLGRFLQTDPIGYEDQVNLYAYVGNDPVNVEDFSGECPWCLGAIIGGGIELVDQLRTPEGRAAYVQAGRALANGDLKGAARAAVAPVSKVLISAGAGAAGVGIATRLGQAANVAASAMRSSAASKVVASITTQAIGNAAAGSGLGGGSQMAKNAIDGKPLGTGVRGATVGGAIGGALGTLAGAAATNGAQNMANATGQMIGGVGGVAAPGSAAGAASGERVGAVAGPIIERSANPCNIGENKAC